LRHLIGVEEADAEVYRKHADELIRFATGLVGPSDASDIVSEAFLSCFNSAAWTAVTEKRPYLFRSVYNKASAFHRTARRRRSRETLAARPELFESPELRPEILTAVFKLSMQQRAVIVLTYWDDLTPASIASLLDISEGSVKRHLARGRSRLKEALRTRD
jgi:RNA polymerase sigma-70 factor (ECF subfamily)